MSPEATGIEADAEGTDPAPLLLVCDVDDTLVGQDAASTEALRELLDELNRLGGLVVLGINSSRPVPSVHKTLAALPVRLQPRVHIGAMGTQVWIDGQADGPWHERFAGWDRDAIHRVMTEAGFHPHDDPMQTEFKASYAVPSDRRDEARKLVASTGQPCRVLASGDSDFDVTPIGSGKGEATMYAAGRVGVTPDRVIVAGDSANDLAMFHAAPAGIVVGNARDELRHAVDPERAYFAAADRAAGVLEGLHYWMRRFENPSKRSKRVNHG